MVSKAQDSAPAPARAHTGGAGSASDMAAVGGTGTAIADPELGVPQVYITAQGRIPDASRSAARREDVGMFQGSQFLQNRLAAHELALSVLTSSRSLFLPAAL